MERLYDIIKDSEDHSLVEKAKVAFSPETYVAESLRDYKDNIQRVRPSHNFIHPLGKNTIVLVRNVHLLPTTNTYFMKVTDNTEEDIMYWNNEKNIETYPYNFYEIRIRHLFTPTNLPIITEVKEQNLGAKKKSLIERIFALIPSYDLKPQPA